MYRLGTSASKRSLLYRDNAYISNSIASISYDYYRYGYYTLRQSVPYFRRSYDLPTIRWWLSNRYYIACFHDISREIISSHWNIRIIIVRNFRKRSERRSVFSQRNVCSNSSRKAHVIQSICQSRRRMMLAAAELTCGCARVRERTQTRADPDRDARQANIMYAAWQPDSHGAVARTMIDSEYGSATASAGPVVALALRAAQTRDRPEWWSGTRYVPPKNSEHSAALGVSGSRECCTARQSRNRARWRILCNAVPYRCTCNITILE